MLTISCINFDFDVAAILIGLPTIIFLYLTLKEGQKQSGSNLSLNLYNVYFNDLQSLIKEFKEVKFNLLEEIHTAEVINYLHKADAIHFMELVQTFLFPWKQGGAGRDDIENSPGRINDFALQVLKVLWKKYDKLFLFLQEVKKDDELLEKYKKKIYRHVELEILQHYLKFCNNTDSSGKKIYDLPPINHTYFNLNDFNSINNFFINNNVFQVHDLEFYQRISF